MKNLPADKFIAKAPKETQAKLKQLRQILLETIPGVEETISYNMPAYKYKGKTIIAFAGYKHHIGFYPMSGSFLDQFKDELKTYKTSKGAVQFPLDKPLPVALIKKLIRKRLEIA